MVNVHPAEQEPAFLVHGGRQRQCHCYAVRKRESSEIIERRLVDAAFCYRARGTVQLSSTSSAWGHFRPMKAIARNSVDW